jgi:hypothetical protein
MMAVPGIITPLEGIIFGADEMVLLRGNPMLYVDPNSIRRLTMERSEARCNIPGLEVIK